MKIVKLIGEKIKQSREAASLTQAKLAELLNVTQVTEGRWELGKRECDFEILQKISTITKKPMSYFFGEELPEESKETETDFQKKEKIDQETDKNTIGKHANIGISNLAGRINEMDEVLKQLTKAIEKQNEISEKQYKKTEEQAKILQDIKAQLGESEKKSQEEFREIEELVTGLRDRINDLATHPKEGRKGINNNK